MTEQYIPGSLPVFRPVVEWAKGNELFIGEDQFFHYKSVIFLILLMRQVNGLFDHKICTLYSSELWSFLSIPLGIFKKMFLEPNNTEKPKHRTALTSKQSLQAKRQRSTGSIWENGKGSGAVSVSRTFGMGTRTPATCLLLSTKAWVLHTTPKSTTPTAINSPAVQGFIAASVLKMEFLASITPKASQTKQNEPNATAFV